MSKLAPLLILLLAPLGCKNGASSQTEKSAKPPKASPATPSAKPTPNKCGAYDADVKLPPRLPCKTDADCSWTAHRPGLCTAPLCSHHYLAGTKAWVKAADALYRRVCRGKRYPSCVRVKCLHRKPEGAFCKDNACALRFASEDER